ncbi:MAG: PKD domain-containing protein [Bacteroidia bacterium]
MKIWYKIFLINLISILTGWVGIAQAQITIDKTDATGCGENGSATVTNVQNGTPPFQYSWSNGQAGQTATNLAKGAYTVTVTDSNNCTGTEEVVIDGPPPLSISVSGGGNIEFCIQDGPPSITLSASASGGSPPYTYSWPGGSRTVSGSGTYSCTVTDTNNCSKTRSVTVVFIPIVCSRDPNDIIGPEGFGPQKWISKFDVHPYKIRFENDPDFATAPAQKVEIRHPFPDKVNRFSLRLADFGFANMVFNVPPNSTYYSQRLDVRDSLGVYVDVVAGIDVSRNEAFWIFQAIDPLTGLAPNDPFKGVLPVNDTATHDGEGFVEFTVMAKSSTVTGDSINAYAEIVFDENSQINTPEIYNLIDAVAPASSIDSSLAPIIDSSRIVISWSGQDDPGGSGIRNYALYYAENKGPFQNYLKNIEDTFVIFQGTLGNTYDFFTLATDNTGNQEAMKTAGDEEVLLINTDSIPPVPGFTLNNGCVSDSLQFTDTSSISFGSIATWKYDFGDDSSATFTSPPGSFKHKYPTAGTYDVTLVATSAKGKSDSTTSQITVYAAPSADFTAASVCDGDSVNFTNTTSGPSSTYSWTFGDGDSSSAQHPQHLYADTGSYLVQLLATTTNGCADSSGKVISVYPMPVADFVTANVCDGDSANFTDQSTGPVTGYNWSFGDAASSTVQHPKHLYDTTGTFQVKLVVNTTNGCADSTTKSISVFEMPQASVFADPVCDGDSVKFTNNSTGSIVSYAWNFGDSTTSSLQAPSHLYADSGTYDVKLVVATANGCQDSTVINLTVHPTPVADFTAAGVCDGDSMSFTSTSIGSISSFAWNFGDNTFSGNQNPVHLYADTGSYNAKLVVSNAHSCADSIIKNVGVFPNPDALPTVSNICLGDSAAFIDSGTGNISNYFWDFGDTTTSSAQSPKHLYSYSGSYNVWLWVTTANGCTDSGSTNLTVYPVPTANFSAGNVCDGDSVSFTNTSSGSISGYQWDFGNNNSSVAQSPKHLYSGSGNYNVKLVVTNSNACSDSITKNVSVYANPVAGFSAANSCLGDSTIFSNTTTGSISSYSWDFGDNNTSSSAAPRHLYTTTGSYAVKLIVQTANGCVDSFSQNVQVYSLPSSNFSVSTVCEGDSTVFTNSSTGGISNYLWRFGDNSTSSASDPKHLYSASGSYNAWLIVENSNGCKDSISKPVTIYAKPTAGFSASSVCDGDSLRFTDTSSSNVTSYSWNFGDNGTSSIQNPAHLYSTAGNYNVKLVVSTGNGCQDSVTRNMAVYANPVADFTATSACAGDSTEFSDASSGSIAGYSWDFGDNSSSTAQDPNHLYGSDGNYNVELTVTTNDGCKDSIVKGTDVFESPVARFSFVNVCEGDSMIFTDSSNGAIASHQWRFGDGTTGSNQNPRHLYDSAANYTVTLIVNTANACIDSVSHSVSVYPKPVAAFVTQDDCFGDSTQFDNQTTGTMASYGWNFGDGNFSNDSAPAHLYAASGTYIATLIVVTPDGCVDSIMDSLKIFEVPVADFAVAAVCESDSSRFINGSTISSGSLSFAWEFGDGGNSMAENPVHLYTAAGSYQVQLVAATPDGCTDTFRTAAIVHPAAVVSIDTLGSTELCEGDSVVLSADKAFAIYAWTTTDSLREITVRTSGTYSLSVTDSNGCSAESQQVVVTVEPSPKPLIVASGPLQFCDGDSVRLDAGAGYSAYLWNNADTTQTILATASGEYFVDVTSVSGCTGGSDTLEVVEYPAPVSPVIFQQSDTLFVTSFAQYQWYKDGNLIPGATDSFVALSGNGSYTVMGTDTNGCSALSQPFLITDVKDRIGGHYFRIYPNPGDGYFNFEAELSKDVRMVITLIDGTGKVEFRSDMGQMNGRYSSQLDFRDLPAGMYFLRVQVGSDVWMRKLVIQ